jgi:hypothetical protein
MGANADGSNPHGSGTIEYTDSEGARRTRALPPITCLNISGRTAVIGVDEGYIRTLFVTDNGGGGKDHYAEAAAQGRGADDCSARLPDEGFGDQDLANARAVIVSAL